MLLTISSESSSEYLRFEWLDKFYQYLRMLQGILLAQFIIFQVIRPVVRHWCCKGIRVLPYLNVFMMVSSVTYSIWPMSRKIPLVLVQGSKLKGYQWMLVEITLIFSTKYPISPPTRLPKFKSSLPSWQLPYSSSANDGAGHPGSNQQCRQQLFAKACLLHSHIWCRD